jgi:hypothetical protein
MTRSGLSTLGALAAPFALVVLLTSVSLARPEHVEPPLEFQLTIDGRAHDVELDRPLQVTIGDKVVELRLTAGSSRLFDNANGICFRYPRHFSFEYDGAGTAAVIWTLEGIDCTLMLSRLPGFASASAARDEVVADVARRFGAGSSKPSASSVTLGGRKVESRRLVVTIAGFAQSFEVVGFKVGDVVHALVVQCGLDEKGEIAKESKDVLDLLARTFRY